MMRSSGIAAGAAIVAVVDMSEVNSAWEAFTAQLQQHESHLDEQKSQLQGQVLRQVRTAYSTARAVGSSVGPQDGLQRSKSAICMAMSVPGEHMVECSTIQHERDFAPDQAFINEEQSTFRLCGLSVHWVLQLPAAGTDCLSGAANPES